MFVGFGFGSSTTATQGTGGFGMFGSSGQTTTSGGLFGSQPAAVKPLG